MKLSGDRCQCTACGEYFNSTYAFDKHRKGDYKARFCLSVDEMIAKGFGKNPKGFWTSSIMPIALSAKLKTADFDQEQYQ